MYVTHGDFMRRDCRTSSQPVLVQDTGGVHALKVWALRSWRAKLARCTTHSQACKFEIHYKPFSTIPLSIVLFNIKSKLFQIGLEVISTSRNLIFIIMIVIKDSVSSEM